MRLISRVAVATFMLPLCVSAQKKNFTITEATNGMGTTLAVKGIKQGNIRSGMFFQVLKSGSEDYYLMFDPATGKTDTTLSLSQLNSQLNDSLKSFPAIIAGDNNSRYFFHKGTMYYLSFGEKDMTRKLFSRSVLTMPDTAEHASISPWDNGTSFGEQLAYTIGNNLFLAYSKIDRGGSMDGVTRTIQVTNDADKNIINGQPVHRDEFGIDRGIFFSPKGKLLAYYRMDQTMVNDYPVMNWSVVPAQAKMIKYPMAGGTSHQVTLQVFNPLTSKTVAIKTGTPADQYLTCVTWSPDEKYIFIALLNRDQNHLWLNQYDVATGEKVKTILEETDPQYVQPQHELSFLPGSNDQFVWWSQRDGFMHLYLYNTQGQLLRQLTKGSWLVNELLAFNKDKKEIIITASKESPMEKNSYAVNWTNAKIRRIDAEQGTHIVAASDNGQYIYDVVTAADIPKKSMLRSTADGHIIKVLAESENTLNAYERPEVRNVTISAADGTPLYGKLILPVHFDSIKKYPVIVYLYNGPNVQLLHNSFPASGNLWYEYMAQRGYIVFTMDGRGSSNRGVKFEQATFGKLGTVELEDQLKGVDYLKSLPYADASRMGIHGWSFGGFMTTSMMLRYPDVFKCGVAGGPVIDWKMYEVMYTERYMNTPQDNASGYEAANLLPKVKNLKGKLLLIHGTDDDVVVWQHSINFIRTCVDNNVPVDYFVYPGHPHNVRGKDRVHLMQKITDYFDLYLKP